MDNVLVKKFRELIKTKKTIDNNLTKNFKIVNSPIHGKGVISIVNIEPGELINLAIYKGIDGDLHTTRFGAYLNHSYIPNAITRHEGENYITYAYKKINTGDEITVDYTVNPELEQPDPKWK